MEYFAGAHSSITNRMVYVETSWEIVTQRTFRNIALARGVVLDVPWSQFARIPV